MSIGMFRMSEGYRAFFQPSASRIRVHLSGETTWSGPGRRDDSMKIMSLYTPAVQQAVFLSVPHRTLACKDLASFP